MDNKRLILMTIFGFSLLMLWENWTRHNAPPVAPQVAAATAQSAAASLPSPMATQSTPAPSVVQAPVGSAADYSAEPKAIVRTDVMLAEVSALGGDVIRVELLKHKAAGDDKQDFVLLENKGKHTYLAQSGLLGDGMPNHKTVFKLVPGDYTLKDGQDNVQVKLQASGPDGIVVTKVLTFKRDSYLVDVAYQVNNSSAKPIDATAYFQLARDGEPAEHKAGMFSGVSTFTGPAFYTEEAKFQKVQFKDIDKGDAKFVKDAKDGWVAMVQHYFVSAYLPKPGTPREFFARKISDDFYGVGVKVPVTVAAGQTGSVDVPLYVGPQEQNKLKEIAPGFNLVVDYGWVTMIAVPLFWLLSFIHKMVGNWGWAIILLTVLIKAAFFPLSAASYKSMAKMKTLMPRMKQLQERYADDKMKLNQEMMALYKKEKVNPMGGCLPIVVQIPVFIALYWTLLGVVEMRQAPWILWITDLSVKDPYYVLPLIMGVSMFVQTKLNPTPPDPMQAKVMLAMPFLFTAMFLFFPSGLVLYWVVNNTLSIAQQWYVTRMINAGDKAAKS